MSRKRIVIVGGVAGGATCSTRLRRLDEHAEIVVLERGPYVSFANCGLPYYVGDVIREESKLLLATSALFRDRFNIEVRTLNEVTGIDPKRGCITVRDLKTGEEYLEDYDALVLSPGAMPIRPPWPGIDLPGIFTLRTVPDSREIRNWIETMKPRKAVVVGGGFIGLEMAENLVHRGMHVSVVELANQVLPPLDPEMAEYARKQLESRGVSLRLNDGVNGFERSDDGCLIVHTKSGAALDADLVVLAIGVRPETELAREAGLEIGDRGGIRVNDQMRTSDPRIWAVGDAVEVKNRVTGVWELIPLAGPANRQGRIAADAICGRDSRFNGSQGTAVCGVLGLTVAMTGATEKSLRRGGVDDFEAVYLHPNQHVAYYPGAKPIHMKLLFRRSDGRVLGAQAAGEEDVARRIDVIAAAIQLEATVYDLEEMELCYAPQYGGAKDPVNFAGMIASNVMRGDVALASWPLTDNGGAMLLDVREPHEFCAASVPGSVNIPLSQLRSRLEELPREQEIQVICGVGQRAYYACRILAQYGFRARNVSGGFSTYSVFHPDPIQTVGEREEQDSGVPSLIGAGQLSTREKRNV
jgi:NADPH-dependent 2,4-dienoyl-CoA reductase/sulfur reductase-like enzyme/rhodanese-related sulfurtransferase